MDVATPPQVDIHDSSLAGARAWFAQKGLSRPREGRVLAGVFASFARRHDVNPLVARLLGIVVIVDPDARGHDRRTGRGELRLTVGRRRHSFGRGGA
jgi:PspC domain